MFDFDWILISSDSHVINLYVQKFDADILRVKSIILKCETFGQKISPSLISKNRKIAIREKKSNGKHPIIV